MVRVVIICYAGFRYGIIHWHEISLYLLGGEFVQTLI